MGRSSFSWREKIPSVVIRILGVAFPLLGLAANANTRTVVDEDVEKVSLRKGEYVVEETIPHEYLGIFKSDRISNFGADAGNLILEQLAKEADDLDLFSFDIGSDLEFAMKSKRKVHSLNTIGFQDSYWVTDSLFGRLNLSLELFELAADSGLPLDVTANIKPYIELTHITTRQREDLDKVDVELRQYERDGLKSAAIMGEMIGKAKEQEKEAELRGEFEKDENKKGFLKRITQWVDEENDAHFANMHHRVTFVRRFPFLAKWLDNAKKGDIYKMRYGGMACSGISLGSGFADPFTDLRAGVSYCKGGHFEIATLVEIPPKDIDGKRISKDDWAFVRLTELVENGHRSRVSWNLFKTEILDWFFGISFGIDLPFRVRPINVSNENFSGDSMDLIFRFNMKNRRAREAYNHAMLGYFVTASELVAEFEAKSPRAQETHPVQFLSKRNRTFEDLIQREASTKLTDLLKGKVDTKGECSESKIKRIPFKGENRNGMINEILNECFVKHREKSSLLVLDRFSMTHRIEPNERIDIDTGDRSIGLEIRGSLKDSVTSYDQFRRYNRQIENEIGKPGILNKFASNLPPKALSKKDIGEALACGESPKFWKRYRLKKGRRLGPNRKNWVGKTSYHYTLGYTQEQIENFLSTPREKMLRIVDEIFDVPEEFRFKEDSARKFETYIQKGFGKLFYYLPLDAVVSTIGGPSARKELMRFHLLPAIDNFLDNLEYLQKLGLSLQPGVPNKDFIKHLTLMFSDYGHGPTFIEALSQVNKNLEEPLIYVSAKNKAFPGGHFFYQNTRTSPNSAYKDMFDRHFGFDKVQNPRDLALRVHKFKIDKINETEFRMKINTPVVPRYLQFAALNLSTKEELRLPSLPNTIVENPGENIFNFGVSDRIKYFAKLADFLSQPSIKGYRIFVAMSRDGHYYGVPKLTRVNFTGQGLPPIEEAQCSPVKSIGEN